MNIPDYYKQVTRETYNAIARQYAENIRNLHPTVFANNFCAKLPPNGHILDLGCGSGRDVKTFLSKGYRTTGIDFSQNLIDVAKEEVAKDCAVKVDQVAKFHLMDMEQLALPEAEYDGVWALTTLLHIPKRKLPAILTRVHQLLKPNGVLAISLKAGDGESMEKDPRYGNREKLVVYYRCDELAAILIASGFRIDSKTISDSDVRYHTHKFLEFICIRV